ncbi:hypothetical protein HDU87_005741 [Geranomyces variabilis]|uniref:Uncharacterized protein n=1 Tax=Geranomyces variabilis TaxID=109894 RepID=A0AAD5XQX7_9FUNG|nr:hypothetical protein HDU87_005741 [Geranomyces variabilis]
MTTSSLQPAVPFTILIRNGTSSDNQFIVQKSTSIDQLMVDANRRFGGAGRLLSGGTQLQTGRTIGHYPSIREGSEIQFIRGCIGGMAVFEETIGQGRRGRASVDPLGVVQRRFSIKTPYAPPNLLVPTLPSQASGDVKYDRNLKELPPLPKLGVDLVVEINVGFNRAFQKSREALLPSSVIRLIQGGQCVFEIDCDVRGVQYAVGVVLLADIEMTQRHAELYAWS